MQRPYTAFLGVFLLSGFVLLLSMHNRVAAENVGTTLENIAAPSSDDGEDLTEKVMPNTTGKGIIWGKSKKTPDAAEEKKSEAVKPDTEKMNEAIAAELAQKVGSSVNSERTSAKPQFLPTKEAALSKENNTANSTAKKAQVLPSKSDARETYLLKSDRKIGSTDWVETLLEASGDAKQITNDLKEFTDKVEVVAGFRYEERISKFSSSTGPLTSVRKYELAKAKMKIAEQMETPELEESQRLLVCSLENNKVVLFSPNGPLRGRQLLLVEDLPGNTLTLDRLLPEREVAVGDSWKISDNVLKSFLSVDAVTDSNVEAVLTAVADNMAMVEMIGDVSGIYLGAATEVVIRAKYQFDFSASRINWLGLLIEEKRSIGHVGPGFDLVARLTIKISPIETPKSLTDDEMKAIKQTPTENAMQLKYDGGKGPWRFLHDRDWYVFQDDSQTTILRKLYRGELVAQCNIADMGKVDVKTMTSLENFQSDLIKGLGKNFGKIVFAEERTSSQGYKELVVLIDGFVGEMPLRWIYHLFTDPNGQQSVVVFVVEADMLEQFANTDETLLSTYRMGK